MNYITCCEFWSVDISTTTHNVEFQRNFILRKIIEQNEITQYHVFAMLSGVCSAFEGCSIPQGDTMSVLGDIIEYVGVPSPPPPPLIVSFHCEDR